MRDFALRQAQAAGTILDRGEFPLVLGGDDSVLFGNLVALRRRGRYGLIFLDAHTDFYLPEQSPTGEASDCDLALATGRGPELIANLDGLRPLVREEDVAALGSRDDEERAAAGGSDPRATAMLVLDLGDVRRLGPMVAAEYAAAHVFGHGAEGCWIHLDTDILDDAVNPAVDYRLADGLTVPELGKLLRTLLASGNVVGMDVTIYNPSLDEADRAARAIVDTLVGGLREVAHAPAP
jgi:arginase